MTDGGKVVNQDEAMELAENVGDNPALIYDKLSDLKTKVETLMKRVSGHHDNLEIYESIALAVQVIETFRLMVDTFKYWKTLNFELVKELELGEGNQEMWIHVNKMNDFILQSITDIDEILVALCRFYGNKNTGN